MLMLRNRNRCRSMSRLAQVPESKGRTRLSAGTDHNLLDYWAMIGDTINEVPRIEGSIR